MFYFHPYLEKWSNLTNIFQIGWNHQLVYHKSTPNVGRYTTHQSYGHLQLPTFPRQKFAPRNFVSKPWNPTVCGTVEFHPTPEVYATTLPTDSEGYTSRHWQLIWWKDEGWFFGSFFFGRERDKINSLVRRIGGKWHRGLQLLHATFHMFAKTFKNPLNYYSFVWKSYRLTITWMNHPWWPRFIR